MGNTRYLNLKKKICVFCYTISLSPISIGILRKKLSSVYAMQGSTYVSILGSYFFTSVYAVLLSLQTVVSRERSYTREH